MTAAGVPDTEETVGFIIPFNASPILHQYKISLDTVQDCMMQLLNL